MSHPIPEPADHATTTADLSDDELAAASGGASFESAGPDGPAVGAVVF